MSNANTNQTEPSKEKPDPANSYERARPSEQSPSGDLDQEKAPVLQKQDSQEEQNAAPNEQPPSRKHDQKHNAGKPK